MSEVPITPVSSVTIRKVGGGYIISCQLPDPDPRPWGGLQLAAQMGQAVPRSTVTREYVAGTLDAVSSLLGALLSEAPL